MHFDIFPTVQYSDEGQMNNADAWALLQDCKESLNLIPQSQWIFLKAPLTSPSSKVIVRAVLMLGPGGHSETLTALTSLTCEILPPQFLHSPSAQGLQAWKFSPSLSCAAEMLVLSTNRVTQPHTTALSHADFLGLPRWGKVSFFCQSWLSPFKCVCGREFLGCSSPTPLHGQLAFVAPWQLELDSRKPGPPAWHFYQDTSYSLQMPLAATARLVSWLPPSSFNQ